MPTPLSKNVKAGYAKQKQAESYDRNNTYANVIVDERQAEREIDRALRQILRKLNK